MESTLLLGDRVISTSWTYGWRMPCAQNFVFGARPAHRGDVALFRYPVDPTRTFVMRVIGLPGETVEIRRKVVFLDGKRLDEPYTHFLDSQEMFLRDNWEPAVVPPDSYFVLGDNRDNSRDSRSWGFVGQSELLGRARVIYWSADPETGRVRWERIGRRVE